MNGAARIAATWRGGAWRQCAGGTSSLTGWRPFSSTYRANQGKTHNQSSRLDHRLTTGGYNMTTRGHGHENADGYRTD